jgi:predicted metal-binding membrane protein
MGAEHGAYCTGCCWALMLLLFAGGIMNLVWIAGLSIVVLIEKIAPQGKRLAAALGALLIGAAVSIAAASAWPL